MVGAAYSASTSRVENFDLEDISRLLQLRTPRSWPSNVHPALPDGLYLNEIQYNPEILKLASDESNVRVEPDPVTIFGNNRPEINW